MLLREVLTDRGWCDENKLGIIPAPYFVREYLLQILPVLRKRDILEEVFEHGVVGAEKNRLGVRCERERESRGDGAGRRTTSLILGFPVAGGMIWGRTWSACAVLYPLVGLECGRRGWGRCNANLNPRGITSSLRRYAEAGGDGLDCFLLRVEGGGVPFVSAAPKPKPLCSGWRVSCACGVVG